MTTTARRAPGTDAPRADWPSARARRWGRVVGEVLLTAVVVMSAPISLLGPTSLDLVVGFVATLLPAAFLWLRRRHPVHVLVACLRCSSSPPATRSSRPPTCSPSRRASTRT
ncbi:MAG TPA: hypothetical protein PKY27_13725 [Arachnia sp.]|nr:hypothetical protein [Arachnia sp.]